MTALESDTQAELFVGPITHRFVPAEGGLAHEVEIGDRLHGSFTPIAPEDRSDDLHGDWWRAYLRGSRTQVPTGTPEVRTVELFCASGGLALGFSQACRELGLEMRSAAAVDQDADAVAIYRRHNDTRLTSTKSVSALVDYRVRGQDRACRFVYEP